MTIPISHLRKLSLDERGALVIPGHGAGNPGFVLPHRGVVGLHAKQKLTEFIHAAKRINIRRAALTGTKFALAAYAIAFIWPRSQTFSYAGNNCFFNPVLLPNSHQTVRADSFKASFVPAVTIAGYPLYSQTTCLTPLKTPGPQAMRNFVISPFGNPLFKKRVSLQTTAAPNLKLSDSHAGLISTKDPLTFELDRADTTFTYRLSANRRDLACATSVQTVRCNTQNLKLKQSKKYDFKLERMFGAEPAGEIFNKSLTTVNPIKVIKSSIKPGSTVYTKPANLVLTLNKIIGSADDVRLIQGKDEVPASVSHAGKQLTVTFDKPLKRDAEFNLIVTSVTAQDQGFLSSPYKLSFKTSGGPKVLGVNIGSYGVNPEAGIVISFDSAVSTKQTIAKFLNLSVTGQAFSFSASVSGSVIYLTPSGSLPRCTGFSVSVLDGLQNAAGISGGSAWSYSSRTICQSVSSIGTSLNGRSILAYKFGSGSSTVIFVGATHGDEASSGYILNSWIDYLEANYPAIPKNRTVIVIPQVNPDGLAAGTRVNARDVDLNRNFPASNWKKDVTMPGGELNKGGGGSAPLSEPESSALASYVTAQNPELVLTYHATGGYAIANESGNSLSRAQTYGNLTGYTALGNSQIGGIFNYDTTGAFEDWLHDGPDVPAILIELWSYTGNEFYSHQAAMRAMIE